MKRIAVFILLLALIAIGANALTVSSPTLGSDKQDRVKNVQTTFTITNNNTATISGLTFTLSAGAESTKYALAVSGPSSLAAGASSTYTVNGTIPLDHPGIDSNFDEKPVKIGTLTVGGTVGSSTDSGSADVFMQAVNQLRIKKARIECDTKSQSLDDGDRIKNLKPGEDCTLEIEVENEFDENDNSNQKIGDIAFDSIDIRIDSSDSDIDVDEEDDIDDLDAGDEDSVTADLEIDDEADDGTISLDIRVSGKDDNGALHGEQMDVRLEVERLSHDIQIRRAELSPAVVSNCQAVNSKLTVNVLNQGKRDEDEVVVEASSADLKFSKKVENIELDKDDSTSLTFDVPVAEDAREGVYRVDVKTYFDTVAPSNTASVELNVNACGGEQPAEKEETKTEEPQKQTTVVVPQAPVVPQPGQAQAAPKKQSSFTESKAYLALLVVLSVIIAIAVVVGVVMLSRKKRD